MKLSYYFVLLLLPTTSLYSMNYNSNSMDGTNNNNALTNPPQIRTTIPEKASFYADIYLHPTDQVDEKEVVLPIPNDYFAMCFYTQVKETQYALITVSPNIYFITKYKEYAFRDSEDPIDPCIDHFFKLRSLGTVCAFSHTLIASNLNLDYCEKTKKSFAQADVPSIFHSYDLKSIESAQKYIGVKLYKDEYRSFYAITNDKGELSYAQSFQENDTEDVAQVILSLDKQYSQLSVSHK